MAKSIDEYAQRAHGIGFYALADPNEHKRAQGEHHQMIDALEVGAREVLVELCRRHLVPAKIIYIKAVNEFLA